MRKSGAERELVLAVIRLDHVDPAVDGLPRHHEAQAVEVEIRPLECQDFADAKAQTHGDLDHLTVGLIELGNEVVVLLDREDVRLALPLADILYLDESYGICAQWQ